MINKKKLNELKPTLYFATVLAILFIALVYAIVNFEKESTEKKSTGIEIGKTYKTGDKFGVQFFGSSMDSFKIAATTSRQFPS